MHAVIARSQVWALVQSRLNNPAVIDSYQKKHVERIWGGPFKKVAHSSGSKLASSLICFSATAMSEDPSPKSTLPELALPELPADGAACGRCWKAK